jgi:hypothetical protein
LCATLAALCVPAAAQATGSHNSPGTITASAGGLRTTTNIDSGYAAPISGVGFQKAPWTSNPAAASWSTLCTSGASGTCQSPILSAGRYLVREAPGAAPAGWRALTEAAWGGGSTGSSPIRPYVGDVTVNGNVTVHPSTTWSPTSPPPSSSGPFLVAKDNPPLPERCGLDVLLLLDRSGSIAPQKDTYRDAARQFVSSLSNTPTRLKISSFSDDTSADQSSFLDLQDSGDVATANSKINGVYSSPEGSTNWDGGMNLASRAGVDVVVFITDGNPTYRDTSTGTSSGGVVDLLDLTAGVASANKVKTIGKSSGTGATILAVGAGTGVTAGNLAAVSGPIAGEDYVTSSVAGLDDKLQEIANKLCGARIHVRKLTDEGNTLSPKAGWTFAAGKPSGSSVTLDPGTVTTTGASSGSVIAVDRIPAAGAAITLTETQQAGYAFEASDCRTGGFANVTSGGALKTTIQVARSEDWYCTFRNHTLVGSIAVEKTGPAWAYHGDSLTFLFTVTNDGPTALNNVAVDDDRCETVTVKTKHNASGQNDSTPNVLDLTDRWVYECTMTAPGHTAAEMNPIINTVTATGRDTQDRPVSDTDQHSTTLLHSAIAVEKAGPAWAYHGDSLTFLFTVTNAGDTALNNVTVADDRCATVTVKTKRNAGGQNDSTPAVLDLTDTWVYECTMTAAAHTAAEVNPIVNTVTATGRDPKNHPVSDTDQHSTKLLHPAIAIDKTGPATALAGSKVLYTLVVTNPGDVYFLAPNVNVSDALCEAPPMLTTKNGDASPGQLDPGDAWTYTCSVQTVSGQTLVDNMGVVSGTDSYGGHVVTARDPAITTLSSPPPPPPPPPPPAVTPQSDPPQQQVMPIAQPVASGIARLSGPNRCVSGPFTAKVTGRGIAKVVFLLDGKRIKTLQAKGNSTVFKVQIQPRGRRTKAHRVTAMVSFKASANTPARTLRFAYLGCARHASAPQFTG